MICYNLLPCVQFRERAQGRRPCKHTTPPKPRGVQKVKASPTRRLTINAGELQKAKMAATPSVPKNVSTPTIARPEACTVRRVWPRAPVKRQISAQAMTAPAASPPAVVLKHVGAGADGFGQSPAAIAASELFVKQQQKCDAKERANKLEEKMQELGRAAGRRVSLARQVQAVESAMADTEAARCRHRLAALNEGRRQRSAGPQHESGIAQCADDHMSIRRAVAHGRGLQDCTNTMWTPGHFFNDWKMEAQSVANDRYCDQ